jgi:hypothetical protein
VDGYRGPRERIHHLLGDNLSQFSGILRQTWCVSRLGKQHNIIDEPWDRDRASRKEQRTRKDSYLLLIRMS